MNAIFLETPKLGGLYVNADRQTVRIPRYKVVRIGKTVKLLGVDGNLDFVISIKKMRDLSLNE